MLSTSLVFPHIDSAAANQQNITASGYDLKEKTAVSERMQPWFSWDHPGPVSPVLFPGTAWGAGLAEQPLNDINPMIEELIKEKAMPGAVVFVAKQGQIVKHEAFGYAYKYKDDQFTEAKNPLKMKKEV